MRKYPRIEIDQKAYDGLQIESVLQHKTAREIATEAILGYISKEALMVISHKTTTPTETVRTAPPAPQQRTVPLYQPTENRPAQLAKDQPAVAHMKELWLTTNMTLKDIATELGRPRTTVQALVDRLIERGELADRPKSGHETSQTT